MKRWFSSGVAAMPLAATLLLQSEYFGLVIVGPMNALPLFPKSAVKLSLGDYCSLRREDGLYVPLVFLSKAGSSRSSFYGALLSHTARSAVLSSGGSYLKIFMAGHLPVKVSAENDAPIVGNIAKRLDEFDVAQTLETMKEKINVRGYRTPLKIARLVKA